MVRYIISLVLVAAAAAIFVLYTRPTYDTVQVQALQIAQYDSALDKAAQLQAVKQNLLTKYNDFSPADLERLKKLLPDHVDNVALILDLDNLASHYGLGLSNVDVSTPASAAVSKTAVGAIGAAGLKYDSLNIKFSTHGTYQQFSEFLRDLEASLRVVDLTSLSITGSGSQADTGSQEPSYQYSVSLRTYWLK
jgi:Tfp pilus assembly protein PilO